MKDGSILDYTNKQYITNLFVNFFYIYDFVCIYMYILSSISSFCHPLQFYI